MIIKKTCSCCGKEFTVPHWREAAKYCSRKCSDKSLHATPNTICTNCGKEFHMKPCQKKRYKRRCGFFCCKECFYEYKTRWFRGSNNHQFGLKGNKNSSFIHNPIKKKNNSVYDVMVDGTNHPKSRQGRVLEHRLMVEQYHSLFNDDYFVIIDGKHILKDEYVVHHKDGNHGNNSIDNLEILTRGEHTRLHNMLSPMLKDEKTGKFIKKK